MRDLGRDIMIGVGAVIFDGDGRLLIVRHVPEHRSFWEGKWIMPGGRLEHGEGLEECARREVREECNLDVRIIRHVSTMDTIVGEGPYAGLHVIYIDYLAEVTGGSLEPGSDVGEARWIARDEVIAERDDFHRDTLAILENIGWIGQDARQEDRQLAK